MAVLARSLATLRIFGDDLVPDEISKLLCGNPTWSASKGDTTPSNSPGGVRVARTGSWRLQAKESKPENINGQVEEILGQLTSDLGIWRALTSRFDVDLFCGWFLERSNEGVSLSPATLMSLGVRGIEMDIDIYGASPED